jgi:hypothetical protein
MRVGGFNWFGRGEGRVTDETRDVVLLHGEPRGGEDLGMGVGRVGLTTPCLETGRSRRRRRAMVALRCVSAAFGQGD